MIAVSVLSATCFSSLSGLPARMLATRSVCSCTYGLIALLRATRTSTPSRPMISPAAFELPFVPMKCSPTRFARALDLPAHAQHARAVRYSKSTAK